MFELIFLEIEDNELIRSFVQLKLKKHIYLSKLLCFWFGIQQLTNSPIILSTFILSFTQDLFPPRLTLDSDSDNKSNILLRLHMIEGRTSSWNIWLKLSLEENIITFIGDFIHIIDINNSEIFAS